MSGMLKKAIAVLLAAALLIPSGWLVKTAKAQTPDIPVLLADNQDPTVPSDTVTVYHETFAGGKGAAAQAGGAALTPVTGKAFAGNSDGAALYVSSRANNWDAADFKFSDLGMVNGKTYTVTVSVYVDHDVNVPSGAQAYLQAVDSYAFLAGADFAAGNALTLTKEFTVDTGKDKALRVQSNPEGASVPFYIGDVLITEKAASGGHEEEPPRDPALPFTPITFEDQQTGGFEKRGDTEVLSVTNEANHTDGGSYALKVEGRTKTWHGPSLRVEKYVDKGYEYKITAWVKLISPASAPLQLSTQVGNQSASYNTIASKTVNASDGWVKFEGTYRYSSISDEYLTIYVESSSDSTASFYIDDIRFEKGAGPITVQKDLKPVKEAYRNDFLIGNAVSSADLEGSRVELLKLHHNVVTTENAMKPDQAYSAQGVFDFTAEDELISKIEAQGLKLHGHVLVWHQQSPAWLNTTTDAQNNTVPLDRETALAHLRTHVKTVMEHYGNKVISWDVVNEAMNDNPQNPTDWRSALRPAPWKSAIGTDYVEQAYLAAREVLDAHPDWDIKLYYNDYNEDNRNKAQAISSMVKELNDKYALTHPGKQLINGIGMQGHYNINTNPDNVKLSLETFISLGVEVSVSELDITVGSNSTLTEKQAEAQGYLYAELMKIFKAHSDHISRVTFWGLNDATSWRASQSPLLFDGDLQAKPAYYGVIDPDTFIREHAPEASNANQSTAYYGTPQIDGNVDAVWSQAAALPVNRYQLAWQGATGTAKALWDAENLYVLIQVSDSQLNKTSANPWEQDSVEIFLDQNNGKTSFYQDDDGQYRINYDNEASFNPADIGTGVVSATKVSGTHYTVEVKLPLSRITPENGKKIGFDVQINDAKDGARQSAAAWNDTTGAGYQDTSVYGILTLAGKPSGGSGGTEYTPPGGNVDTKDGAVAVKPEVKTDNGQVTGAVSGDSLKKALEQAAPAANGKKQLTIELPKEPDAKSYGVLLPAESLTGKDRFEMALKTEAATLLLPSGMLSNVADAAGQASIRVGLASTERLDAAVRGQIGDRPVIDLSVAVGDKTIAWNNPDAPVTVSIPYTPTEEERANPDNIVVWYMDGEGHALAVPNGRYDAAAEAVVFRTTHFSTFATAYVRKTFGDLASVPWAQQAINAMAARDVIQGAAEDSFAPAASIKRGDFVALLVRALELKGSVEGTAAAFSDVLPTDYSYRELAVAKELGIAAGYEDGAFRPDSMISRQDMIALAARALVAAGKPASAGGRLDAYSDAADIAGYAADSAAILAGSGIINGKDGGKLAPMDPLTRAEAAVILYRIWDMK